MSYEREKNALEKIADGTIVVLYGNSLMKLDLTMSENEFEELSKKQKKQMLNRGCLMIEGNVFTLKSLGSTDTFAKSIEDELTYKALEKVDKRNKELENVKELYEIEHLLMKQVVPTVGEKGIRLKEGDDGHYYALLAMKAYIMVNPANIEQFLLMTPADIETKLTIKKGRGGEYQLDVNTPRVRGKYSHPLISSRQKICYGNNEEGVWKLEFQNKNASFDKKIIHALYKTREMLQMGYFSSSQYVHNPEFNGCKTLDHNEIRRMVESGIEITNLDRTKKKLTDRSQKMKLESILAGIL